MIESEEIESFKNEIHNRLNAIALKATKDYLFEITNGNIQLANKNIVVANIIESTIEEIDRAPLEGINSIITECIETLDAL